MRERLFRDARRVVVKIGTSTLVANKKFDPRRIRALTGDIAEVSSRNARLQLVLVSSGAIGSGMLKLGRHQRPVEMPKLQAVAAVGQPQLMRHFIDGFEATGRLTAQILLTREDFGSRARFEKMQATLEALAADSIIPVINENDTVSTKEIEFGDNDQLSALVASLIGADLLILLSDADGFYADYKKGPETRVALVDDLHAGIFGAVRDVKRAHTKGGMTSKLQAIDKALKAGIPCVLANGHEPRILSRLFSGEDKGTLFLPKLKRLSSKKHWIAYMAKPQGAVRVDEGAARAVTESGRSLLAKGIAAVPSAFEAGSVVRVENDRGELIGKGIVNFSSAELLKIRGSRSGEWAKILGKACLDEVIHRDNFVCEEQKA